jgi:predicted N-acetyltransferase YhbS
MKKDGALNIERIDESRMDAGLDEAIRSCLCDCFPADKDFFSKRRDWHGSAPAWSLVVRAGTGAVRGDRAGTGAAVVGHVGIVLRTVRVHPRNSRGDPGSGVRVPVAGVQNVAVHPSQRGTGLGKALMRAAMVQAEADGVPFGLLFCVPGLGPYYASLGWSIRDAEATMRWEGVDGVPIPGKNICMVVELAGKPFPEGDIDLLGADW